MQDRRLVKYVEVALEGRVGSRKASWQMETTGGEPTAANVEGSRTE